MNCRSCNANDVESIIPLGKLPLANALLKEPRNQEVYNLEVMLCKSCGLAQLKDIVSPEKLFSDYVYFSSNSETMLHSVKELCERIIPELPQNAFVVEIASNDGYLLKNYVEKNIKALGVDPAQNIAEEANKNGIPTLCDFFNFTVSEKIKKENGKADVIHANNVMAHVPEINDFVRGIQNLLNEKGYAVIEVPYFLDLVQKLEFDTIYHEHVYYFSLKALKNLFEKYGLCIFDYEKLTIHGGSCRLFVGHKHTHQESPTIKLAIEHEEEFGLYDVKTYAHFMQKIKNLGENLREKLEKLKNENKKIAAYGASAKGTTLLNFFNIPSNIISFVVDRSDKKNGLYTPGTNLPIHKTERLIEEKIDVALLLSWNFKDEILAQQKEFSEKGGKFLCPIPEVTYI